MRKRTDGPIYDRTLQVLREDEYLYANETTLKVQAKGGCDTGWVWAILSKQAIVYAFDSSRSGDVAKRLIGKTKGTLVIDGFSGYNSVVGELARTRVGCWSHSRRKFFRALTNNPEAREVMEWITELYKIEHLVAEKGLADPLVEGAQNLAVLQSMVATCNLHRVNPYEYIKDVLIRVPTHKVSKIDELLPWNWPELVKDG